MNKPVDKTSEKAQVHLALGLTREQADFLIPSDEELASLIEKPTSLSLSSTRKAQIMDAIANDPDTFGRWMRMVDTAQVLELGAFSPAAQQDTISTEQKSATFIDRCKQVFKQHLFGFTATGSGLGLATALAVVLFMPVGLDSRVTGLYEKFGSDWRSMPEQLDVIRSGTSATKLVLSAEDLRLKAGVLAGLERLGPEFKLHKLSTQLTGTTDTLDSALNDALYALGQIAAISQFKCNLGAQEGYYLETWQMIQELQPTLANFEDMTSVALNKTLQRTGKPETQVCRMSKQVISRITP